MAPTRWQPVVELLEHMLVDEDLLLQWGLHKYGDIRGEKGQAAVIFMQREQMEHLIAAVRDRAE